MCNSDSALICNETISQRLFTYNTSRAYFVVLDEQSEDMLTVKTINHIKHWVLGSNRLERFHCFDSRPLIKCGRGKRLPPVGFSACSVAASIIVI